MTVLVPRIKKAGLALKALLLLQAVCGMSVIARLVRSAGGSRIAIADGSTPVDHCVTVLLPVLNEEEQIDTCLSSVAGLNHVQQIVVIDGGSSDDTVERAKVFASQDPRIQILEAGPSPDDWNGKVWGLEHGLQETQEHADWILTIDADVTVHNKLVESLLESAGRESLDLLSVATRQRVHGFLLGILHPSMLTTLVYRFGIPGKTARSIRNVQANGQCFLIRRDAIVGCGGFAEFRRSICEDVTIARHLVASGYRVGFQEAGELVLTEMYRSAGAAWYGWSRSLPTRDRYFGVWGWWRLIEVVAMQGLLIPMAMLSLWRSEVRRSRWLIIAIVAVATRIGTLAGTRRGYEHSHWSYWLSPLVDLPVSFRVLLSALQSEYSWRGQRLVRGE